MSKPIPPCRDCRERSQNCHSPEVCGKWAEYINQKKIFDAGKAEYLHAHMIANDAHRAAVEKTKRHLSMKE